MDFEEVKDFSIVPQSLRGGAVARYTWIAWIFGQSMRVTRSEVKDRDILKIMQCLLLSGLLIVMLSAIRSRLGFTSK